MRREDHRMPREEAEALLRRAQVLRLGMVDEEGPYVVPLNFGFDGERIYLHGSCEGRRLDAIARHPRVCFEVDEGEVVPAERPCGYTMRFSSVIGYGRARVLETAEEKRRGLEVLMRHYGGPTEGIDETALEKTSVVEVVIESMDAKRHEVRTEEEGSEVDSSGLKFDERGLIPAVVQQHDTGEVLMVAWMDAEALRRTVETGTTWFWSRSRQEHWNKGATSGNVQHVKEIRYDCDGDTLLVLVEQVGVACHTGARSCFFRTLVEPPAVRDEVPGDEGLPLS